MRTTTFELMPNRSFCTEDHHAMPSQPMGEMPALSIVFGPTHCESSLLGEGLESRKKLPFIMRSWSLASITNSEILDRLQRRLDFRLLTNYSPKHLQYKTTKCRCV